MLTTVNVDEEPQACKYVTDVTTACRQILDEIDRINSVRDGAEKV